MPSILNNIAAIPPQVYLLPVMGLPEASLLSAVEASNIKQQEQPIQITPVTAMQQSGKLAYSVDQELGIVVTKFMDTHGQVVQQLPPEQILNMYKVFAKINSNTKSKLDTEA